MLFMVSSDDRYEENKPISNSLGVYLVFEFDWFLLSLKP